MRRQTVARSAVVRMMLFAAIALSVRCRAQLSNLPLELNQFKHTAWNTQDGSLKAGVRAIAQTPDGYLWLGTEFGLVRFDGIRFQPWTPPPGQQLPSANVRSLIVSRDGTLWIGTLEGLASWKDGQLKRYLSVGKNNVLALVEDSEGTVWAGTFGTPKARLCAIGRAGVQCYGDDGTFGQWVWSLYEDRDGRLWVGSETGLWRWRPGPPKCYPTTRSIETAQAIVQLAQHTEPLAITEGIWQLVGEKLKEYQLAMPPGSPATPINMFVDHDRDLWIGTLDRGLLRISRGRTSWFGQADGLSSDHVMTIFEDRESNIWVGTTDGLDRFHLPTVIQFSSRQGLSSPSVWAVLQARDNSVWVTTLDGLNQLDDGRVAVYRSGRNEDIGMRRAQSASPASAGMTPQWPVTAKTDPNLPDDRVGSLYEDGHGRIWVSTPSGIARLDGGNFRLLRELPGGWVNAMVGDNHGGVWISYQDLGLLHWADGKVVERYPGARFGGNVIAASVLVDPVRGGLWLGFFEGGIVFFKDGQVRAQYRTTDGLGAGRVMHLELDRQGVLWAATEGGLSRLQSGKIATLTSANGLPCNTVHWATQVDDSFWLYTACGLIQIPREEIDRWATAPTSIIRFKLFDGGEGVRSRALLTGYTPRLSRSADGKLWFTHLDAVSVLDTQNLRLNSVIPPVHIEQVVADGRTYAAAAGLRLPARVRQLDIDYTALSLTAPQEVQFRVRLDGLDNDWRVPRDPRHANYTNLGPGAYTFRVKAANNSGVWNEAGVSLQFSIAPAWYQTAWFMSLCCLSSVALLWAGYQFRIRQLHRNFEMTVQTRVDERTRIARDLHDTLLQSFQGLLPRLQAVIYKLPKDSIDARNLLEEALDRASDAIAEAREAVQGLRASTLEQNDLAVAIRTLGEELATAEDNPSNPSPPTFEVAVEGESRELDPSVRDEIYRFAAEALRNAYRHAAANRLEVEIRYASKFLRLRIRDDGKGIGPEVLRADGRQGHYGLHGMRERAALVGGKLTIWSKVDSGTEIELIIPAKRAYGISAWRSSHLSKEPDKDVKQPVEHD